MKKVELIGNKLIGQIEILEKNGNITKEASKSMINDLQNIYIEFKKEKYIEPESTKAGEDNKHE